MQSESARACGRVELSELAPIEPQDSRERSSATHVKPRWSLHRGCSCSDGELSLSEVVLLLLLSDGLEGELVLGQLLSEGSGLLVSEVRRGAALLGVSASLVSSLLVDHSKNLTDRLSHKLRTQCH